MRHTIAKGEPADYDEIVAFGSRIFGEDFPTLLPKVYAGRPQMAREHFILKVDGRIKALVGSIPMDLRVGPEILPAFGIGTVCVDTDVRGLGYMRLLMDIAMEEARSRGRVLGILGGQRQRYEFWGFTPAGTNLEMDFSAANFRGSRYAGTEEYAFEDAAALGGPDLDAAISLHSALPVHVVRPRADFFDIARSYDGGVVVVRRGGRFAGCLGWSHGKDRVMEILLEEPAETDRILEAYRRSSGLEVVHLNLAPWRTREIEGLRRTWEGCRIHSSTSLCVLDLPTAVRAFLSLKGGLVPLADGRLVLDVEERGRFFVSVADGRVDAGPTEEPADLELPYLDAVALLFSHAGLLDATRASFLPLMRSWFPLPFAFPQPDMV